MIDRVSFVADQLRALAPDADWQMAGIDRSVELARILVRTGVTDLWALQLIPVSETINHPPYSYETEGGYQLVDARTEVIDSYAFNYYGVRIGFLGTPDRPENQSMFQVGDLGVSIAWSAEGHGNVTYCIRPNAARTALRIVPVWGSSSDAGFVRSAVIMAISVFAMMVLPMAGINVANAIGTAVLPSTVAASYPALATAIGNVALSAAVNGGDIEKAVKGVALSSVAGFGGTQVGQFASAATNSELFGQFVNVATRTAIAGGDIKRAVGIELLSQGVTRMSADDSFIFQSIEPEFDANDISGVGFGDFWTNEPVAVPYDFGSAFGEFSFGDFVSDIPALPDLQLPPADLSINPVDWNPFPTVTTGGVVSAPPANQLPANPNSQSYTPSQIIQGVTSAAMSALNLVRAYRQLDSPAVQTTARVVRPNGAVSVIGNNGLIQTRNPDGSVSSALPPVGVPQATTSGNYVVNNGDGTYTVVSPAGQSQTVRYSSTVSATAASGSQNLIPGVSNTILLFGAVGAFLLARK